MVTRARIVLCSLVVGFSLGATACDSGDSRKPGGDQTAMPEAAAAGLQVFNRLGCAVCHSFDDKPLAGPPLADIYGKPVQLLDGTTMVRDDAYLSDSILASGKHVVDGYRPTMINYGSMLQDGELEQLLALLRYHTDPDH